MVWFDTPPPLLDTRAILSHVAPHIAVAYIHPLSLHICSWFCIFPHLPFHGPRPYTHLGSHTPPTPPLYTFTGRFRSGSLALTLPWLIVVVVDYLPSYRTLPHTLPTGWFPLHPLPDLVDTAQPYLTPPAHLPHDITPFITTPHPSPGSAVCPRFYPATQVLYPSLIPPTCPLFGRVGLERCTLFAYYHYLGKRSRAARPIITPSHYPPAPVCRTLPVCIPPFPYA